VGSFVFDYRYFGSSGGAPRQLYSNRAQLEDWRAAIALARQLPGVDPDRVALWGTSSSGGHVVALAAEDARIAAVVSQMPFADGLAQFLLLPARASFRLLIAGLRDRLSAATSGEPRLIAFGGRPGSLAFSSSNDALGGLEQITPSPSTWRDEIAPRFALTAAFHRPGRAAARVRCPLLVCVADGDLLIAPEPAVRIARMAANGELRRFPFGHFAMYTGPGFDRVAAVQADFLRRVLLGEPAGPAARPPELRAIT
jgi:fermentation-respiration switch protein FrsA (DUF1100 family)